MPALREGEMILKGHALDLIEKLTETPDLIVTDPPYAFGGTGDEHAISATVATVLRESARRLAKGRWMLVMCAASWRSQAYMVEAVRGVVEPVRVGTWCKPKARTKVQTTGWAWASVKVIAFKKGKALEHESEPYLDHVTAEPIMNGRRAELPPLVANWMVAPFAVKGGLLLDPFAGSGRILTAASIHDMRAIGYELNAEPQDKTLPRVCRGPAVSAPLCAEWEPSGTDDLCRWCLEPKAAHEDAAPAVKARA